MDAKYETKVLQTLIDKKDGFEVVGDLIAQILADEIANQKKLAYEAGDKNPELWDLLVLREASNPLENFITESEEDECVFVNSKPVVNVWFESATYDRSQSTVMNKQISSGLYNVDVIAAGFAQNENGEGHTPGDLAAALECQRASRLVRNILMSSRNTYLGVEKFIGKRWINSMTALQPEFNNNNALKIHGMRFIFNVEFVEFSPQYEGERLEEIGIDILRSDDGFVLAKAQFDYTTSE